MRKLLAILTLLNFVLLQNVFAEGVVDAMDSFGITPLMLAVIDGDEEGVEVFLKSSKQLINNKDIGGATALHLAARSGNAKIVEILINQGAKLDLPDNEGWTPLMRASVNGHSEIVNLLVNRGSNAFALNNFGDSALIHSVNSSCQDCVLAIMKQVKSSSEITSFSSGASSYSGIINSDRTHQQIEKAINIARLSSNKQLLPLLSDSSLIDGNDNALEDKASIAIDGNEAKKDESQEQLKNVEQPKIADKDLPEKKVVSIVKESKNIAVESIAPMPAIAHPALSIMPAQKLVLENKTEIENKFNPIREAKAYEVNIEQVRKIMPIAPSNPLNSEIKQVVDEQEIPLKTSDLEQLKVYKKEFIIVPALGLEREKRVNENKKQKLRPSSKMQEGEVEKKSIVITKDEVIERRKENLQVSNDNASQEQRMENKIEEEISQKKALKKNKLQEEEFDKQKTKESKIDQEKLEEKRVIYRLVSPHNKERIPGSKAKLPAAILPISNRELVKEKIDENKNVIINNDPPVVDFPAQSSGEALIELPKVKRVFLFSAGPESHQVEPKKKKNR